MSSLFATPKGLFKALAFAEAVTWTLLLAGLTIRALVDSPPLLLTVVGGLHGFIFLAYGVVSALVGVNQRWGFARTALAVALAIVPYATIPFERAVEKQGRLTGAWRKEPSEDKRDDFWLDRLFRWFLNRPALLVLVLFAAIVAIFAALLIVGPPGGWPKSE
jgi:integral membrane protein